MPLPSQPLLVLIYRHRRDGSLRPLVAGWLHTDISFRHREVNPDTMSSGKLFQSWASATRKARLPTVDSLTSGTTRLFEPAERSARRPERSATRTNSNSETALSLTQSKCKPLTLLYILTYLLTYSSQGCVKTSPPINHTRYISECDSRRLLIVVIRKLRPLVCGVPDRHT